MTGKRYAHALSALYHFRLLYEFLFPVDLLHKLIFLLNRLVLYFLQGKELAKHRVQRVVRVLKQYQVEILRV